MTSFSSRLVATCTLQHIEPLQDVSWITVLESKLNPYALKPLSDQTALIARGWRRALFAFILQDLRSNLTGQRIHLWAEGNCMVVFSLNTISTFHWGVDFSSPAALDLAANEEFLLELAERASWIFCPQTSGSCAQVGLFCMVSVFGCIHLRRS